MKALVLLSGGVDSSTCLALAKENMVIMCLAFIHVLWSEA